MTATPIPAELYGAGRLRERARMLASEGVAEEGRALPVLRRLEESGRFLERVHRELQADVAAGVRLSPAAQWLFENSSYIQTHRREVREYLPRVYYMELPRLREGPRAGYPRVYEIAVELIEHTDAELDVETITAFIQAYQTVTPLKMGELWALGPMLRLGLIENLRRLSLLIRDESQEAATEVSVRNSILSLRAVGAASWRDLFESVSLTERILRQDPSGVYPRMDFDTRDWYRHAVEDIARRSPHTEEEVAEQAIEFARLETAGHAGDERRTHVGYYLIDGGAPWLKAHMGYRQTLRGRLTELIMSWGDLFYLVGIEILTLSIMALLLSRLSSLTPQVLGFFLLLLPATEAGVAIMNQFVIWLAPPRRLPKLDFSEGIPEDCAAMVVVPTLLLSPKTVEELLEGLEIRYLANRDPQLTFALLTDFPDAPAPPGDEAELVRACATGIRMLNERYGVGGRSPFYLFHRRREWNPKQATWMGWERKRGKLIQLNQLLRGEGDAFEVKIGELSVLRRIRYVITLDTDTRLPRDAAHKLAGAIAHPLNQAIIDPDTQIVREGYGILQPRVGISVHAAGRSRLARIYSGQTGFDIYTTAVSDVYQDLFGEGSYTGKGIYDVGVFQATLSQRFPQDALLSHDLIEGGYARAALVTDIEVIDDYPSHYSAYSRRKHRWVRGDWQVMLWLLPRVPDYLGRWVANPLSLISKWKILDNLRRSLIEIAMFALLVAGWFFLPGGPLYWTLVVVVLALMPAYAQIFFSLLKPPPPRLWRGYLRDVVSNFASGHINALLSFVFLAHQTCLMLDAIIRTIVRRMVTGKKLLEWESAAQAENARTRVLRSIDGYLWMAPFLAGLVGVWLAKLNPRALVSASPFLAVWLLSPLIARWLNALLPPPRPVVLPSDRQFLRILALRTWRYFQTFWSEQDNWLIPDHFQEDPESVAHRTSPTNLGLLIDAKVAAHDLGYLTQRELAERLQRIFRSMERLERCHGHFYNWYDTCTLSPLPPRFVSTVDSGNLAASLVALKQACLELLAQPVVGQNLLSGVRDHCLALMEAGPPPRAKKLAEALVDQASSAPSDLFSWHETLQRAVRLARDIARAIQPDAADDLVYWAESLRNLLQAQLQELEGLAPWLALPLDPGCKDLLPELGCVPSLGHLPDQSSQLLQRIENLLRLPENLSAPACDQLERLRSDMPLSSFWANQLIGQLRALADHASELLEQMDFRFLFDRKTKLLAIGYHADRDRVDESSYDLLASEARLASFMAIAKGDVPQENWFHLGRTLTKCRGERVLLSWGGTMFEYLMPLLWTQPYPHTLLAQSLRAAVQCHRKYGKEHGIPWGVSEAAYNQRDPERHYYYRAFGVPELGLKPGLSQDIVVAPYSAMLALLVDPPAAIRNLRRQAANGWLGRYGFYDSVDYTPERVPPGESAAIVRAFMSHHQGMSLLALDNVLNHYCMQNRFHSDPIVQATELLLQERISAGAFVARTAVPSRLVVPVSDSDMTLAVSAAGTE